MLTVSVEEEDKIRGRNSGCDDYVSKPFSYPELIARVQAVLRRVTPGGEDEKLSASGLEVDVASQRVTANGQPVHRSEEHTSELQSLMRISYAVFCLKKKKYTTNYTH